MVEDCRDALSIICSRGRVKDCQLGEQKKAEPKWPCLNYLHPLIKMLFSDSK